jgi:D-xylose transport system permease protein
VSQNTAPDDTADDFEPPAGQPAPASETETVSDVVLQLRRRLSSGDLGSLPVIIGIVVIWIIFFLLNERFLSPLNVTNLVLQMAGAGTIAVGITLVLLLGEIDLSVAQVSGLAAAIMAVLNVNQGLPGPVAILAALLAGLAIGLFNGFWVTRFRVPSFVVTLAGFLGWQGLQLYILGRTGTINISDASITFLARDFLPEAAGWIVAVAAIAIYAVVRLVERRRRLSAGLPASPMWLVATKVGGMAVLVLGTVAFLNRDRGFPVALLILLTLVVVFDVLTRRTRWGRHVFAVGGNAEAARRAGISTSGIRVSVFAIASTLAAFGGVILAARLLAVNQSSGGGDLLLEVIAAAVIGGTSLFGGRGTVWGALFGALVIQSITNGINLLGYASSIRFMVTGGVLLLAVTVDAVSRRSRAQAGLG